MKLRPALAETAWQAPSVTAVPISATAFSYGYAPDYGVMGRGAPVHSAAPQPAEVRRSGLNDRSFSSSAKSSPERVWEAPTLTALSI